MLNITALIFVYNKALRMFLINPEIATIFIYFFRYCKTAQVTFHISN
jgi:hypothetical protein